MDLLVASAYASPSAYPSEELMESKRHGKDQGIGRSQ